MIFRTSIVVAVLCHLPFAQATPLSIGCEVRQTDQQGWILTFTVRNASSSTVFININELPWAPKGISDVKGFDWNADLAPLKRVSTIRDPLRSPQVELKPGASISDDFVLAHVLPALGSPPRKGEFLVTWTYLVPDEGRDKNIRGLAKISPNRAICIHSE